MASAVIDLRKEGDIALVCGIQIPADQTPFDCFLLVGRSFHPTAWVLMPGPGLERGSNVRAPQSDLFNCEHRATCPHLIGHKVGPAPPRDVEPCTKPLHQTVD